MNPYLEDVINKYRATSLKKKDFLREVLQQSALLGLARHNFFEHAAFYGGTALRILYGLDRFSEDLDFSLLKPKPQFDFKPFLEGCQRELASFGFHVDTQIKEKESVISSAFLKANTLKLLMTIEETDRVKGIHPEEKISIKLEIDTDPPPGFEIETRLVSQPLPFYIVTYVQKDLFAGKMHAILCRERKINVKGRDWYDLIWFIKNKIPVHLAHLANRMHQSQNLKADESLDHAKLVNLLKKKIATIDWEQAKSDVKPFISDHQQLNLWSEQFFNDLIVQLRSE
jgi:predicted nucleotidyltransferase component of viral defense system